jgi:hypothetical protein
LEYGWTKEIGDEYYRFKERIKEMASEEFKKHFHKYGEAFQKLTYYARPHIIDGNNIANSIYDPTENNVNIILERYLDGSVTAVPTIVNKKKEYVQGKLF